MPDKSVNAIDDMRVSSLRCWLMLFPRGNFLSCRMLTIQSWLTRARPMLLVEKMG